MHHLFNHIVYNILCGEWDGVNVKDHDFGKLTELSHSVFRETPLISNIETIVV